MENYVQLKRKNEIREKKYEPLRVGAGGGGCIRILVVEPLKKIKINYLPNYSGFFRIETFFFYAKPGEI